ncbi:MAG: phosphate ABC transporter permease subunit PstC [Planctomycetaceae bacterium]
MSPWRSDAILVWILRCSAILSGTLILVILLFLGFESFPALQRIGFSRFLSDNSWHPAAENGEKTFGLLPMIAGTLLVTGGAILLAAPLGIGTAVFIRFYAPLFLKTVYRRMMELLAGIPSVVFGFWGLVVLVPLIARWQPPGASLLAAVLILAIMIVPTITLIAAAAMENVSSTSLHAAAALGLSRWRTVFQVVLPSCRSGIFTAVLLGICRALGETMAVLMVCGNIVQIPRSLFQPVRTLTSNIALEMAYAMNDHRSALFVSGLLLMLLVTALVTCSEYFGRRAVHE